MGFSYEDNCCQSQGVGKSIEKKLLKGSFRVTELIKVAANAHHISSVNKGRIRLFKFFFSKIMFQNWGCGLNMSAGYTRVFMYINFHLAIFTNLAAWALIKFWSLSMGTYWRWALIRGWRLLNFHHFGQVESLFCKKTINNGPKQNFNCSLKLAYSRLGAYSNKCGTT